RLPPPSHVIVDRPFFLAACAVLVLLVLGYFLGPALGVPVWATTFAGVVLLGAVGVARQRLGRSGVQQLSLGVLPFVIGLFALVQAGGDLRLHPSLGRWVARPRPPPLGVAGVTGGAGPAPRTRNNPPGRPLARPPP